MPVEDRLEWLREFLAATENIREGHVLKKEREAKEDGRYIIFYTFDDEGGES